MGYTDFKASDVGRRIGPLLASSETLHEMERLSRRGRPAVEAIGRAVRDIAPDLDNTGRQHVGRLVRDALAARGWRPVRKARVAPDHLFSWGAVYAPAGNGDGSPGRDRLAKARALMAEAGLEPRNVDAFLADRRRIWGE